MTQQPTRALDSNINVTSEGATVCAHCTTPLGEATGAFLNLATWKVRDSVAAGAGVVRAEPSHFVDRPVAFRQAFCPGCYTLLLTEVAPRDEPSYRTKRLAPDK